MPCSGPRYSPAAMADSAACASATAESASTVTYEFSPPSTASMRSRNALVSSTGESCFDSSSSAASGMVR